MEEKGSDEETVSEDSDVVESPKHKEKGKTSKGKAKGSGKGKAQGAGSGKQSKGKVAGGKPNVKAETQPAIRERKKPEVGRRSVEADDDDDSVMLSDLASNSKRLEPAPKRPSPPLEDENVSAKRARLGVGYALGLAEGKSEALGDGLKHTRSMLDKVLARQETQSSNSMDKLATVSTHALSMAALSRARSQPFPNLKPVVTTEDVVAWLRKSAVLSKHTILFEDWKIRGVDLWRKAQVLGDLGLGGNHQLEQLFIREVDVLIKDNRLPEPDSDSGVGY
jgi:hypothetical protein